MPDHKNSFWNVYLLPIWRHISTLVCVRHRFEIVTISYLCCRFMWIKLMQILLQWHGTVQRHTSLLCWLPIQLSLILTHIIKEIMSSPSELKAEWTKLFWKLLLSTEIQSKDLNSMTEGLPWKGNTYSGGQEIPCFHGTQMFLFIFTK